MTYRSRLLLYVGMLIVLLVGTMTLSLKAARDVVVAGTEEHLRQIALRKEGVVRSQLKELDSYVETVAGDQRLQESLYGALDAGTGGESLDAYFESRYASLPADWRLLVVHDGQVLLGDDYPPLVRQLLARDADAGAQRFFFQAPHGVVMVASRPLFYSNQLLATAAVARVLDQAWLDREDEIPDDYLLFFERRGHVLWSSNARYQGMRFDPRSARLDAGDRRFSLRQVPYGADDSLPRLWFGVVESTVVGMLDRYRHWVYALAGLGSLAALLVGWLLLRNFSRPMQALMETTEKMINGELPVMARSEAATEMDQLVNRFADVLDALRREQSKLERANRKLQETVITDSLTGVHNRRYLQEVTPNLFAQVVRDGRYLTAVLLDLDYFKSVNDSWGHLGGDAVLVHFARLLKHNSRANDFLFRIGGEEFLILNVAEHPRDSVTLASKIRTVVSRSPATYQGHTIPMTVSIGVSCCNGRSGDISLSTLMRTADKALYQAKSSGRNCVVLHTSCQDVADARQGPRVTVIEGGNKGEPRF